MSEGLYLTDDGRFDIWKAYPALARYCGEDEVSPHQAAFLTLPHREALYGGAAGGGKSFALLMAALQYVDVPGYSALILRRTFPQLSQPKMLIPLAREWLGPTDARWNERDKQWTFPSGAVLKFGHVEDEAAVTNYQGGAYHFVGFDELTQFTETQYTYIAFSRQRRSLKEKDIGVPIRVRSTTNPGGIGATWVKERFGIMASDPPDADRIFIPAKVWDNIFLDAQDYADNSLAHLPEVLRKQFLDGDWGAFEGAAYPMFDATAVVVNAFDLPASWERFEHMDFGSTNPTAWYLTAVDYDGNLVVADEFYEPGLPSVTAPKILDLRKSWHAEGASVVCFADPSVFDGKSVTNKWGQPATIADEFREHGIAFAGGNRDRPAGYVRIAELLRRNPQRPFPAWHEWAGTLGPDGLGSPRMFIFGRCQHLIDQIQAAPLEADGEPHPGEAVSRRWEGPYGHAHAALRYGVMSWPGPSSEPEPELDDPRAERLRQLRAQEFRDDTRYVTV